MKFFSFAFRIAGAASVAVLPFLAACQSTPESTVPPPPSDASVKTMEQVMNSASTCWYKSGDKAFAAYRLAPELNAIAGPPRLLIVPASAPEGRPVAVIQAQGTPAVVQTYGPLMATPVGKRISTDVNRWAAGGTGCGGQA